jgi:hypothetical protein
MVAVRLTRVGKQESDDRIISVHPKFRTAEVADGRLIEYSKNDTTAQGADGRLVRVLANWTSETPKGRLVAVPPSGYAEPESES